jgi:hypothetical protein
MLRTVPRAGRHDEGGQRERVRHGRFLVSGSAWPIAHRPAQHSQGLHDKGVGLFLHQQGLDTSTTAGKAMFQMLGVFAEFERGIIRERVNAELARAIWVTSVRMRREDRTSISSHPLADLGR